MTTDLLPWAELAAPYVLGLVLMIIRLAMASMFMPGLSNGRVPARVRLFVVAAFAVVMTLGLDAPPLTFPENPLRLLILIFREVAIGAGIGFAVRLVVLAAELSGSMAGISIGLSLNVMVDPSTGDQSVSLGSLLSIGAMLVFVALDGHHIMLSVMYEHFNYFPVGRTSYLAPDPQRLAEAFNHVVRTGLQLASPAIIVALTLNIALAFVSRAVPAVNLFGIGLGMLMIAGFMAMGMQGQAIVRTTEEALRVMPENMIDFSTRGTVEP